MARKKSTTPGTGIPTITAVEAERQASLIVDKLLDKDNPIGRRAMLEGLRRPQALDHISKELGLPTKRSDPSFKVRLRLGLEKKDRKRLIALFAEAFAEDPIPPGKEKEVTNAFGPQILRKALLEVAETLKGAPGKPPFINPSDYPVLAKRADSLRPVVQKVLEERFGGNPRGLKECLEFWSKQYPEPCQFLLRYEDVFSQLLGAKKLPKPGKKQATRAHIIADAIAGCEYGLTFTTSIERVRQGRRMLIQTSTNSSAN